MVGGGISGLAAAWRLIRLDPGIEVTVLETSSRLGGKLVTFRTKGFLVEGAADGFLARKPPAMDWALELGLGPALVEPRPEHRFSHVWWDGALHRMPEGFSGLVPADPDGLRRSSLLTPQGAERAAAEPSVPLKTQGPEESVEDFFTRRYGAEAFERLMEPLLAGIFAGDAGRLSAESAFPQLTSLEQGGSTLTEGVSLSQGNSGTAGPAFRSFHGGMAQFPEAFETLLRRSGVSLRTGQTVRSIDQRNGGFAIVTDRQTWQADAVVVALPPRQAAALVSNLAPPLAQVLQSWPVSSVANLHLAFDQTEVPQLPAGSGFVAPRAAGVPYSAATWSSQKWPGRAPEGRVLLRFYFGGARDPDGWQAPEASMVDTALHLLAQWHHGRRPQPLWHRVFRWQDAFAQPNLGHADRHRALEAAEIPGLVLAGGYFSGVGIPDCLARAEVAAHNIVHHLQRIQEGVYP